MIQLRASRVAMLLSAHPNLASRFEDLSGFINSLPAKTSVGVGYMRNGTVQIAQNLTGNHEQAAEALRLPMASSGG